MKWFIATCFLAAGCSSEYERTYGESEAEYVERLSACGERAAAGEHVLTLVDTDRWRVGAAPLWSTSERVRAALGAPDSTFEGLQLELSPELDYFIYERPENPGGRIVAAVVNDSLSYLSDVRLGAAPLSTDRGRFGPGAPLSAVREAFPESYECRDWGPGVLYHNRPYPVLVATDTARGAHVALLFGDGGLLGIGTDYYLLEREHGTMP